jgi:hypothetical protein
MRLQVSVISTVIIAFLLSVNVATFASIERATPRPMKVGKETAQVQQLQAAYRTLEAANHDYKGHRKSAMREIDRACKLLGVTPRGDGGGKEPQGTSDAQLREAQSMLQSARATAAAQHLVQVVGHIDGAIREISLALQIK